MYWLSKFILSLISLFLATGIAQADLKIIKRFSNADRIFVCSDWPVFNAATLEAIFSKLEPDRTPPKFLPFPTKITQFDRADIYLIMSGGKDDAHIADCLKITPEAFQAKFMATEQILAPPFPTREDFEQGKFLSSTYFHDVGPTAFAAHQTSTIDPDRERSAVSALFQVVYDFCLDSDVCDLLTPYSPPPLLDRYRGTIVEDWLPLWRRCSEAVESNAPLDTTGLLKTDLVQDSGPQSKASFWARPKSKFIIAELLSRNDPSLNNEPDISRECQVAYNPNFEKPSVLDEALILHAFLEERRRLLQEYTHRMVQAPSNGFITAGYERLKKLPNGCPVKNYILLSDILEMFMTVSAWRKSPDCEMN